MAILKAWSPEGWSKNGDVEEGQREPDDQRRGLWYRTLPAYLMAAAIWAALLGLLYLYFVLMAPKELKGRIEREERLGRLQVDCRDSFAVGTFRETSPLVR